MEKNPTCIRALADWEQITGCIDKVKESQQGLTELSSLLALAGNEVRLKILYMLEEEGELCPCDLADILSMSVPAISQHLRKLKDGSLVQARRDGQTIFYSLREAHKSLLTLLFAQLEIKNSIVELI